MLNRVSIKGFIGLLCLLIALVSCTNAPSSFNDTPPELPPAESMAMGFSSLEKQKSFNQTKSSSTGNVARAIRTAMVMKVVVDLNLAIPKALLAAAQNSEPMLNEKDKWEWNYSKQSGDSTYAVRLVATHEGEDSVEWNFYVTNSDLGLSDQLFFSGTTNKDGSRGEWIYYSLEDQNSQEKVSRLNWKIDRKENVELKLEVISDRSKKQGDYIEYTFDGTHKTAVYYDKSEDQKTEIQINIETHIGYVVSPGFSDGKQACWDENFQDIACGEL